MTIIEENGFVKYRRRDDGRSVTIRGKRMDNRWVIPYNRDMCVKYDAHINVERCAQKKVIKYLHKYMHKGADRATIVIEDNVQHPQQGNGPPNYEDVNEIKQYLDCRYVSPVDAVWRIFKFEITQRYPSVELLQYHLPGQQYVIFDDRDRLHRVVEEGAQRITMLIGWFIVNSEDPEARRYPYATFPSYYVWNKGMRKWTKRKQRVCIGRLPYAHPNMGERYYLRMLLHIVQGATSYEDLRTVNGILYSTFKEACLARGLVDDANEWHEALAEASLWATGAELRSMFCSMLMFSEVSDPHRLWEQHWEDLTDDLQRRIERELRDHSLHITVEQRQDLGLYEIEMVLNKNGRSLRDYPPMPLPSPNLVLQLGNRLIREQLDYDQEQESHNLQRLLPTLNSDQMRVFQSVIQADEHGGGGCFFIYGSGGTGKTYLWKTIVTHFRSKGLIVLCVASSGIAALLLPFGKTAHSMFKIPIDADETSTCSISKQSELA